MANLVIKRVQCHAQEDWTGDDLIELRIDGSVVWDGEMNEDDPGKSDIRLDPPASRPFEGDIRLDMYEVDDLDGDDNLGSQPITPNDMQGTEVEIVYSLDGAKYSVWYTVTADSSSPTESPSESTGSEETPESTQSASGSGDPASPLLGSVDDPVVECPGGILWVRITHRADGTQFPDVLVTLTTAQGAWGQTDADGVVRWFSTTEYLGNSDELPFTLEPGTHSMSIEKPHFPTEVIPITVACGQITEVELSYGNLDEKASWTDASRKRAEYENHVGSIYFATKKSDLDAQDQQCLDELVQAYAYTVRKTGRIEGVVHGHADMRTSYGPNNEELSQLRAAVVREYLAQQFYAIGADEVAIDYAGLGDEGCRNDARCQDAADHDAYADWRCAQIAIVTPVASSCFWEERELRATGKAGATQYASMTESQYQRMVRQVRREAEQNALSNLEKEIQAAMEDIRREYTGLTVEFDGRHATETALKREQEEEEQAEIKAPRFPIIILIRHYNAVYEATATLRYKVCDPDQ